MYLLQSRIDSIHLSFFYLLEQNMGDEGAEYLNKQKISCHTNVDPRSRSLSPVQSWLSQPRWCLASVYLRFLRCDTSWMLSFSPKSCMRKEYPLSSLEPTRLPCRHNVAKPAECWHVFKPQVFYTGREWTIHKQVHIWVESELMRLDVSAAVIAKLAFECLRVPGCPVIWFLRLECKYDEHSAQFMEVWVTFLGVLLALPFFLLYIFFDRVYIMIFYIYICISIFRNTY